MIDNYLVDRCTITRVQADVRDVYGDVVQTPNRVAELVPCRLIQKVGQFRRNPDGSEVYKIVDDHILVAPDTDIREGDSVLLTLVDREPVAKTFHVRRVATGAGMVNRTKFAYLDGVE